MVLAFLITLSIFYYLDGWAGAAAAAVGWCIGDITYYWKRYKPRIKNFFRHNTEIKVKGIILIPIVVWCVWYAGWLGLVGAVIGWCVGELICRKFLKTHKR